MPKFLEVTDVPAAKAALNVSDVSVLDYGATGNGTTDDTSAIHDARDAAGVGGTLVFPPGTYLTDGLTASVAGQTWMAAGAIIKAASSVGTAKILYVTADNVTIDGGTFDGQNLTVSDGSQMGVQLSGAGNTIRNATVQNSPFYGIASYGKDRITVERCTVLDCDYSGIWVQNPVSGPTDIYDINITDNLISSDSNTASGIGLYCLPGSGQRINRAVVTGNNISLAYSQTDVNTGCIGLIECTDWTVSNNVCKGGYISISCANGIRGVVSDNTVLGFRYVGVELPEGAENVSVVGNVIDPDGEEGSGSTGIETSNGSYGMLSIAANTILGFTAANSMGIKFSSAAVVDRVSIVGNVLASGSSAWKGIWFSAAVDNLSVTGNVVDGDGSTSSDGLVFTAAVNGATITGNHFSNFTRAAVTFGTGSAVTQNNIHIAGNSYVSCAAFLDANYSAGANALGANVSRETLPLISQLKDTNGKTSLALQAVTNAVNYLNLVNTATGSFAAGNGVTLQAAGADTDINLFFRPKGFNGYTRVNDGTGAAVARFMPVTSPVNYWSFLGSATSNAISAQAVGSDSNISINLVPKNSGTVQANGNPVGVKVAVPPSAGATGVPGQWAAESGWLYICVAANTWERVAIASW